MDYYIGLGSNLGDRENNLRICRLKLIKYGCKIIRASSLYLTEPWHKNVQPWFLNQVLEVTSELEPHDLLSSLEDLEKKMGRTEKDTQEPRIIDIDILLAGDNVIKDKNLIIPHPQIAERRFILAPWREIAAGAFHPVIQQTVEELWRNCQDKSAVYFYSSTCDKENSEGVK